MYINLGIGEYDYQGYIPPNKDWHEEEEDWVDLEKKFNKAKFVARNVKNTNKKHRTI